MTDTPLSDVMSMHADTTSPESYDRFITLFRSSTIGIVATGIPEQPDHQVVANGTVGAGMTTHGDGRRRILAYADPEVALRNFGPRFNAGLPGEVLLQMCVDEPDCTGILVNSAIHEISLIISQSTTVSAIARRHETSRNGRFHSSD
jgi:hypothetical protein